MRILVIISPNSFSLASLFSSLLLGYQWHQYLTNEWMFLRICSVFFKFYLICSYWIILFHLFSSSLTHSSVISIMPLSLFCEFFTLDYCIFQFQNVHLVLLHIFFWDFLSFSLFKEYLLIFIWTFLYKLDALMSLSNNFNTFTIFLLASANGLFPCNLRFFFLVLPMIGNFDLYSGHFEYYIMRL